MIERGEGVPKNDGMMSKVWSPVAAHVVFTGYTDMPAVQVEPACADGPPGTKQGNMIVKSV